MTVKPLSHQARVQLRCPVYPLRQNYPRTAAYSGCVLMKKSQDLRRLAYGCVPYA